MPRTRSRIPLNVYLNARLVGQFWRQASGATEFQYAPAWLERDNAIPVSLSLPLREDKYIGAPVVAVFDNLLPDNDQIRRRMAERVRADGYDAYSLLSKIGRDCIGALQFLPEGIEPEPAGKVTGRAVDDDYIAHKIADLKSAPLGMDDDEEFRISLAGAQEKTAFLFWKNKWHVPHGTTPTTHIMKPQIGRLPNGIDLSDSVENEFLCMKLTAAFGIPTAAVQIAEFRGSRTLVIERFDRQWTRDKRLLRLPQEDCCQALSVPPTRKYEPDGGPGLQQILDLLQGSDEPDADRRTFLNAQVVFWLLGATDGHAKNFSVFLEPGGRFSLTPLYDVMSAQPALDSKQLGKGKMKLAMAVGDKRHYVIGRIHPRHFIQTAGRSGVPETVMNELFDEVLGSADRAVEQVLAELPRSFPTPLTDSIIGGLRSRLQVLENL